MRRPRGYLLMVVLGVSSFFFLISLVLAKLVMHDRFLVERSTRQLSCQRKSLEKLYAEFCQNLENGENSEITPATLESKWSEEPCDSSIEAKVSYDQILLQEDFSSLALSIDLSPTEVSVSLDALGHMIVRNLLGNDSDLLLGSKDWRNLTFTSALTLEQGTSVGMWVRARREQAGTTGYLYSYTLLQQPLQGGTFAIDKYQHGIQHRLASRTGASLGLGGLTWLLGLQHRVTAGANQEKLWMEVDGRKILEAQDDEPITGGQVGLRSWVAGLMLVDSLSVRSIPEIRSLWKKR